MSLLRRRGRASWGEVLSHSVLFADVGLSAGWVSPGQIHGVRQSWGAPSESGLWSCSVALALTFRKRFIPIL